MPRPLSPRGVQRREQPGTFAPLVGCFFSRPDLLGMSYLLLLFDRKDVLADALGIRRRLQDFLGRVGENLDPMIDIQGLSK